MKITAMYWSATEQADQKIVTTVAHEIAEGSTGFTSYDFTLPAARAHGKRFTPDDLVVFGTPVYAGRVPNIRFAQIPQHRGGRRRKGSSDCAVRQPEFR